jgi:hypothetical protein
LGGFFVNQTNNSFIASSLGTVTNASGDAGNLFVVQSD